MVNHDLLKYMIGSLVVHEWTIYKLS